MASTKRTLLEIGALRGFLSSPSPLALPPGYVSYLFDGRLEQGVVRERWGGATVKTTISGANLFRGVVEYTFNGVQTLFWAGRDSGKTIVAASTDSGATWATITPSAGAFGDTRFSSDALVRFALVNDGTTDWLIMQNGIESPRVWNGSAASIITQGVRGPIKVGTAVTLDQGADFSTSPAPTNSNAAHLAGSILTLAGTSYFSLDVKAGVLATDTSIVSFTPFVFGTDDALQFLLFVKDATSSWRSVKVEAAASSAGPWTTVLDPATTPVVEADGVGASLGAVSAGPILGATVGAFRFSYQAAAPTSTVTIGYLFAGQSGLVPGGASYATAFGSSVSPNLSAGTVSPSPVLASFGGYFIPVSPLIGYRYRVSMGTQIFPTGFNRTFVYRNDYGTTGYYYVAQSSLASSNNIFTDLGTATTDLTRPLPSSNAVSVPIGTAMESANGRLFVGGGNRLWYSAAGQPFTFARDVTFVDGAAVSDSAGSFSLPGETIMSVVVLGQLLTGSESIGIPQMGAVTLYVASDRWLYVVSGYDALSLNKSTRIGYGTLSPFSVARSGGAFYYLDRFRQVQRVEGTDAVPISKSKVDSETFGIPNGMLGAVWGAVHDGRYRMAYAPPGGTANSLVLLYSELLSTWESIDRVPSPYAAGLLSWYDASAGRVRLYSFGGTSVYDTDVTGTLTDAGVSITMRLVFGAQRLSLDYNVLVGSFYLMSDAAAGGSALFNIVPSTGPKAGTTIPYGTISLDPLPTQPNATLVVRATAGTGTGTDALTVVPTLDVAAKGGTRLYRVDGDFGQGNSASNR